MRARRRDDLRGNTTSEMGDPAYLRSFYDETRLTGLRFNFDIGHAHLADGPEEERVEKGFAPLRIWWWARTFTISWREGRAFAAL